MFANLFQQFKQPYKLTVSDIKNVLASLHSAMFGPTVSSNSTSDICCLGEHVIVAWYDKLYNYELGVIHEYESHQKIVVSHLVPTYNTKTSWIFPEEALVLPAERNQILMFKVKVTYHQSPQIRVSLDQETVKHADSLLQKFEELQHKAII